MGPIIWWIHLKALIIFKKLLKSQQEKNNNTCKIAETMAEGVIDGSVALDNQEIVANSPGSVTDDIENEDVHKIKDD